MTVGSLFAGIGGFDLGFERAGFEIKWQVEIDDYAQRVLAKHWPHVRRYGDIRAIDWATVEPVDVLCGGFPCQPHSLAGTRRASDDERDLWGEFARAIRGVRPRWVVAENVPGLLSSESGRFFGRVLGDLAEGGYDAEWDCLPASAFGAHHDRDRVFVAAYLMRERLSLRCQAGTHIQDAGIFSQGPGLAFGIAREGLERRGSPQWGGDVHGIPDRMDRIKALGNSIYPPIAEWIAHRIKEADGNQVTEAVASGRNRGSEAP